MENAKKENIVISFRISFEDLLYTPIILLYLTKNL